MSTLCVRALLIKNRCTKESAFRDANLDRFDKARKKFSTVEQSRLKQQEERCHHLQSALRHQQRHSRRILEGEKGPISCIGLFRS
jgi:hypothetical protein